jgi:hypothetical protein
MFLNVPTSTIHMFCLCLAFFGRGNQRQPFSNSSRETYEDIMGVTVPREKFREIAAKFLEIDVSHDEIHH